MAIDATEPGAGRAALRTIRAIAAAFNGPEGDALLRKAAIVTRDELVFELSKPGSGRTYTTRFYVDGEGRLRQGPARPPHTASAPGEPPAPDTGELRSSIDFVITDGVAYVGTGLAKGRLLEYGFATAWGTVVAARPWMSTVVAQLPELLREVGITEAEGVVRLVVNREGAG